MHLFFGCYPGCCSRYWTTAQSHGSSEIWPMNGSPSGICKVIANMNIHLVKIAGWEFGLGSLAIGRGCDWFSCGSLLFKHTTSRVIFLRPLHLIYYGLDPLSVFYSSLRDSLPAYLRPRLSSSFPVHGNFPGCVCFHGAFFVHRVLAGIARISFLPRNRGSLLITPMVSSIPTCSITKTGLAVGIASSGSSAGGIIYHIVLYKLQGQACFP